MRKFKIEIIIVLVLLIGALSAFLFSRQLKTKDLNTTGIYWSNGVDYEISSDMSLVINENSILEVKDQDIVLGSTPIYMNDARIMLTSNMSYYNPCLSTGLKAKKLPVTTELLNKGNEIEFVLNTNEKSETSGFLFDGNKTYILLETMTVVYDGHEVVLPPFSFVQIENRNWVQYFDSNTQEFKKDNLTGAVVAMDLKGNYKINMSNDVIAYGDGEYLMTTNLDALKNYFD